MNLAVTSPWMLWLLPLSVLPLIRWRGATLTYPALDWLPADPLSTAVDIARRLVTTVAVVALILGASGLYRQAVPVERIGSGAQIVLLLDRSRSMDEPFASTVHAPLLSERAREPKGTVARRLLDEFVLSRHNDLYGMVVFSTRPIPVLPLTDRPELVRAAIEAGNVGRGLADTDVGAGLLEALEYFEGRPYTGSRLILLISDGGARLDVSTRYRIENLLLRHRVALYWIYLRSRLSPGIGAGVVASEATAPARVLHRFFSGMRTPYRAYDAEDPQALGRAIADVDRLQSLPIRYLDWIPRRDLSVYCYRAALGLLAVLAVSLLLERRTWLVR